MVPPERKQPGLVYPANAGFQTDLDQEKPLSEKRFYLANLLPTRAGEQPIYRRVLEDAGFRVATLDPHYRLEGEADFFPIGPCHLLTFGRIEKQRFVPTLAFPPWKRIYGFRSDERVARILEPIVAPRPILKVELLLEAHYHGDTALCGFGSGREFLLAWPHAITPTAWDQLREAFGDRVVELEEHDAQRYAANAFTLTQDSDSLLLLPDGVSDRLLAQVRERGVTPITVDVSEFLKKGGGSVKCMIGDLGPVEDAVSLGRFEFRGVAGRSERASARAGRGAV